MQMKMRPRLALATLLLVVLALLSLLQLAEAQLEAVGAVLSVVPVTSILATAGLVGVKLAALSRLLDILGYDRAYLAQGGKGTAAHPIGLSTNYAYMFPYVPGLNISVSGEHRLGVPGKPQGVSSTGSDAGGLKGDSSSSAAMAAANRKTYPAMGLPGDYEAQQRPFRGSETLREIFQQAGVQVRLPSAQQRQQLQQQLQIPAQGNNDPPQLTSGLQQQAAVEQQTSNQQPQTPVVAAGQQQQSSQTQQQNEQHQQPATDQQSNSHNSIRFDTDKQQQQQQPNRLQPHHNAPAIPTNLAPHLNNQQQLASGQSSSSSQGNQQQQQAAASNTREQSAPMNQVNMQQSRPAFNPNSIHIDEHFNHRLNAQRFEFHPIPQHNEFYRRLLEARHRSTDTLSSSGSLQVGQLGHSRPILAPAPNEPLQSFDAATNFFFPQNQPSHSHNHHHFSHHNSMVPHQLRPLEISPFLNRMQPTRASHPPLENSFNEGLSSPADSFETTNFAPDLFDYDNPMPPTDDELARTRPNGPRRGKRSTPFLATGLSANNRRLALDLPATTPGPMPMSLEMRTVTPNFGMPAMNIHSVRRRRRRRSSGSLETMLLTRSTL